MTLDVWIEIEINGVFVTYFSLFSLCSYVSMRLFIFGFEFWALFDVAGFAISDTNPAGQSVDSPESTTAWKSD